MRTCQGSHLPAVSSAVFLLLLLLGRAGSRLPKRQLFCSAPAHAAPAVVHAQRTKLHTASQAAAPATQARTFLWNTGLVWPP